MTTYPGRGAWTSVGKDNGSISYVYISGKPMDGSTPTKSINHEAVKLGVLAIQKRLNSLSYKTELVCDGVLGPATSKAIQWFQTNNALYIDGDCGPQTCRALWRPLIKNLEDSYKILGHHLWGIVGHESLLDPGAVGATTPADRGLAQWNTAVSGLTIQQAHDPVYALTMAARRISHAQSTYAAKGAELQTTCSIAQWNSPLWAGQWYLTKLPPNAQIATYVKNVLIQAANF